MVFGALVNRRSTAEVFTSTNTTHAFRSRGNRFGVFWSSGIQKRVCGRCGHGIISIGTIEEFRSVPTSNLRNTLPPVRIRSNCRFRFVTRKRCDRQASTFGNWNKWNFICIGKVSTCVSNASTNRDSLNKCRTNVSTFAANGLKKIPPRLIIEFFCYLVSWRVDTVTMLNHIKGALNKSHNNEGRNDAKLQMEFSGSNNRHLHFNWFGKQKQFVCWTCNRTWKTLVPTIRQQRCDWLRF